ncbi:MAG TPA: type 1 glutamine amidotransferase [Solirubrobacteraceae bacterium]|jgi:GMP synthase-like glutamine amidotransferase|nr:type 1 glutamine amidotransferase [Solirubrobacteraceae bacterium]
MSDSESRPILVLQHAGCEPPGAYEDELLARRIPFVRVRLDRDEELPHWQAFAGILAMGGAMGVEQESVHPWLVPEKRLIAEAVHAGAPYWGVCLGAQLLAASLGARVASGPEPELGVLPVQLTAAAAEDPVFGALPTSFPTLQWHGETYELPTGAVRLARSSQYEQQAFVFDRAYALQFHLEVDAQLAGEWMRTPSFVAELEQQQGSQAPAALLTQMRLLERGSVPLARELFARWLTQVVGFGE